MKLLRKNLLYKNVLNEKLLTIKPLNPSVEKLLNAIMPEFLQNQISDHVASLQWASQRASFPNAMQHFTKGFVHRSIMHESTGIKSIRVQLFGTQPVLTSKLGVWRKILGFISRLSIPIISLRRLARRFFCYGPIRPRKALIPRLIL